MRGLALPAAVFMGVSAAAAARAGDSRGEAAPALREDVSVRAPSAGPAVALPAPSPGTAVVDEVVGSLRVLQRPAGADVADARVPAPASWSRPFPEAPYLSFSPRLVAAPYDVWSFEVLDRAGRTLLRRDGAGRLREPLEWDGSGPSGDDSVRAGDAYWFRFTGRRGPASFVVTSEPAVLRSLALRGLLGGARLEALTSELFEPGSSRLKKGAQAYLGALAERMGRVGAKDGYTLELRERQPASAVAKARARAVSSWLAERLLINAALVRVLALAPNARGEVLACALPAEKGDIIGRP